MMRVPDYPPPYIMNEWEEGCLAIRLSQAGTDDHEEVTRRFIIECRLRAELNAACAAVDKPKPVAQREEPRP